MVVVIATRRLVAEGRGAVLDPPRDPRGGVAADAGGFLERARGGEGVVLRVGGVLGRVRGGAAEVAEERVVEIGVGAIERREPAPERVVVAREVERGGDQRAELGENERERAGVDVVAALVAACGEGGGAGGAGGRRGSATGVSIFGRFVARETRGNGGERTTPTRRARRADAPAKTPSSSSQRSLVSSNIARETVRARAEGARGGCAPARGPSARPTKRRNRERSIGRRDEDDSSGPRNRPWFPWVREYGRTTQRASSSLRCGARPWRRPRSPSPPPRERWVERRGLRRRSRASPRPLPRLARSRRMSGSSPGRRPGRRPRPPPRGRHRRA